LLGIELVSAECFFSATPKADALVIAQYMADLALSLQQRGYEQVDVYLDRNTTHLVKMQTAYGELSAGFHIHMRFLHFAAYSPALNPVEYLIHWTRQRYLHHGNCRQWLAEVKARLVAALDEQIVLSSDQLINLLVHIEKLVVDKQKPNLSP
jgi:hypothetical protein